MRAGRLRHKITIQSASHAQDALGEDTETWSDLATVWGDIQPGDGRKYVSAEQNVHAITHEITLRYYPGLSQAHRLKYEDPAGTRIFNIVQALDLGERHIKMMVLANESSEDN